MERIIKPIEIAKSSENITGWGCLKGKYYRRPHDIKPSE